MFNFVLMIALTTGSSFDVAEVQCDAWRDSVNGTAEQFEACMRLQTGSSIPVDDGSFWIEN